MARVLIVFGTTEGHTRKIAERIEEWLRENSHETRTIDSSDVPEDLKLAGFDHVILAGSLHQEKHQASLIHFVKEHRSELQGMRTAFLSVSLTAVIKDEKHAADCRRCMQAFYDDTEWTPSTDLAVAGALLYTQYDFLKRMLMKMIAGKEGGDTDTSRDFEYTDWQELRRFITDFVS